MRITSETPFSELCLIRDELENECKLLKPLLHRHEELKKMEVLFLIVSVEITKRLNSVHL